MCTSSVSSAQQSSVQTQIDITLLAKQNSAAKLQGESAVALIETAAQVGKSLDTGTNFDATA